MNDRAPGAAPAPTSAPGPAPGPASGPAPAAAEPTFAPASGPASASAAARPVLTVKGLTVESVRGRALVEVFQDASLALGEGEVVLLVGPSGSGKSLFTKLLAGLLGRGTDSLHIRETARAAVHLRDGSTHEVLGSARYPRRLRGAIGYMFQHHALFDELSVEDNITLARDQAEVPLRGALWRDWLHAQAARLKLDRLLQSPIEPLSGGQRQRVALLRMLAVRPEILIFDEPTSGLDPDAAKRVAALIREVQRPEDPAARAIAPRLSLVVTHDYENLIGIADRVVLLNPERGFTVYQVPDERVREEVRAHIVRTLARFEAPRPYAPARGAIRRVRDDAAWARLVAAPGILFDRVIEAPRRYLRSAYWHTRFFASAFRLLVIDAVPFIILGGAAVGCVLAYFSLNAMPRTLQSQAEPIFLEEMIRTLGVALYQVIAPLFTAIAIAARSGAAVAGHVASLERSSQLDALRVLGLPPAALYADKVAVSFMLGLPLLTALCFVAASASALVIVLLTRPLATWWTFTGSYFEGLGPGALDFPYAGTWWLLAKLVPAGFLAGAIAWRLGSAPKETSEDVNRAITQTIMRGILAVIAVFFLVLLVEIGPR